MTTQPEYVLVPRGPTQEQVDAGRNHDDLCDRDNCRRIYRAMTANGVPVAQVHAPAPDSTGNGGEQTRPSSPGAGAPTRFEEYWDTRKRKSWAYPGDPPENWGSGLRLYVKEGWDAAITALQQPSAQEAKPAAYIAKAELEKVRKGVIDGAIVHASVYGTDDVPVDARPLYTTPTLRPVSDEDVEAFFRDIGMRSIGRSVFRRALESFLARRMGGGW